MIIELLLSISASECGQPTATSPSKSSQLSKSLDEVLRDKDALPYFISYLKARDSDSLIKFWLAVEAFRLSATDRTHHGKKPEPELQKSDKVPASTLLQTPTSSSSAVEVCTSKNNVDVTRLQNTSLENPKENSCGLESGGNHSTKRTSDCGHFGAVGDSPQFRGRVPAHGEISDAMPRNFLMDEKNLNVNRIVIDHCSASDPYHGMAGVVMATDGRNCVSPGGCGMSDCEVTMVENNEMSSESIQKGKKIVYFA